MYMETEEFTIRVPKSWGLALTSLAESADYPSLNAMMLETLDIEFDLPKEEWMGDRVDSWWEKL